MPQSPPMLLRQPALWAIDCRYTRGPCSECVPLSEKFARDKALVRERGRVAEFVNAWLKDKLGLRRFRVRGLAKAGTEAL
ncbi:hypothetical protein HED50_14205 [Ochrobactrum oryzae]|nr:hypothetical protein [Brucella oryzae]